MPLEFFHPDNTVDPLRNYIRKANGLTVDGDTAFINSLNSQPAQPSYPIPDFGLGEDETVSSGPAPSSPVVKLQELLRNRPERNDFQPSTGRKILGGLAGAFTGFAQGPEAGAKNASSILDKPYKEALEKYSGRVSDLGQEIGLEDLLRNRGIQEQELGLKKAGAQSNYLKAWSDYVSTQLKNDPNQVRLLAEADAAGKAAGESPFKKAETNLQHTNRLSEIGAEGQNQKDVAGINNTAALDRTREEIRSRENIKLAEILNDRDLSDQQKLHELELNRLVTNRELATTLIGQIGANKRSTAQIKSEEERARDIINSRERIAKLQNDLKKDMAKERAEATKNQRIPITEQQRAKFVAENEISKSILDEKKFAAIFEEVKDKNNNVAGYRLKSNPKDIPAGYLKDYTDIKNQVTNLQKILLNKGYNPKSNPSAFDIEEEPEDQFSVEEVE